MQFSLLLQRWIILRRILLSRPKSAILLYYEKNDKNFIISQYRFNYWLYFKTLIIRKILKFPHLKYGEDAPFTIFIIYTFKFKNGKTQLRMQNSCDYWSTNVNNKHTIPHTTNYLITKLRNRVTVTLKLVFRALTCIHYCIYLLHYSRIFCRMT